MGTAVGPGVSHAHQRHLQVHGRAPDHIGQAFAALVQAQIVGVQVGTDTIHKLQFHPGMGLGKSRQQREAKGLECRRINHQMGSGIVGNRAWGLHGPAGFKVFRILPCARV